MDRGGGREEGREEGRMEGGRVVKMKGERECGAVVRRGMPSRWLLGIFDLHWSCPRVKIGEMHSGQGRVGREGRREGADGQVDWARVFLSSI